MSCLFPFTRRVNDVDYPNSPCGYCRACRKEKRRQWYMRLYLENMCWKESSFLTLTYADAPVSLDKLELQRFQKRLRKKFKHKKLKFFSVGEYGDRTRRSHYHVLLFGHDFNDSLRYVTAGGFSHPDLERAWGHGHVCIGDVTPASIKYCAAYVIKKLNGKAADSAYVREGGEIVDREFSIKSPIGRSFFDKHKKQLILQQTVVIDGVEMLMPKYYFYLINRDLDYYDAFVKRDLLLYPPSEKELERFAQSQETLKLFNEDLDYQIFNAADVANREKRLDLLRRRSKLEEHRESIMALSSIL